MTNYSWIKIGVKVVIDFSLDPRSCPHDMGRKKDGMVFEVTSNPFHEGATAFGMYTVELSDGEIWACGLLRPYREDDDQIPNWQSIASDKTLHDKFFDEETARIVRENADAILRIIDSWK